MFGLLVLEALMRSVYNFSDSATSTSELCEAYTKHIRKVKIESPENISKAFFYSLVAL
jgi:hypothetical protein